MPRRGRQKSFGKKSEDILHSDPKLQKCWVNLERIDVAEEKKRLENSLSQTKDEVRNKRIKVSEVKREIKDEDDVPEMPREANKTTFLKATPKKIISIKGIGRVTLPKKARLISKLETGSGPLIIIDRKRPDIRLEKLYFPRVIIEETIRYYKERQEESKIQEEATCKTSDSTSGENIRPTITESKTSGPTSTIEAKAKAEPPPPSQVSATKTSTKKTTNIKANIKKPSLPKKLSSSEKQLADLANFLGGHWFSNFSSGPFATHQNVIKAFQLQKAFNSNQNQGPKLTKAPVLPEKQSGGVINKQPITYQTKKSQFEQKSLGNKENSSTTTAQECQILANGPAGPAPIQEAKVVENGSLSNAIQVQEPRWDNSANSVNQTVVKIRTFFEREGDQFVKKVKCPCCKENVRSELFKNHWDTLHKSIPALISDSKTSNSLNDKIPTGCVRCKHCRTIMPMNDVLTHGCFDGSSSVANGPINSPSTANSQIRVKPISALAQNDPKPKRPILAQCSQCKTMILVSEISSHVCSSNIIPANKQSDWPVHSNMNSTKLVYQTQPRTSQDEVTTCQHCFVDIPVNAQPTHVCQLFFGSTLDDPNALLKCTRCNNKKLYSLMALKEHHIHFHSI